MTGAGVYFDLDRGSWWVLSRFKGFKRLEVHGSVIRRDIYICMYIYICNYMYIIYTQYCMQLYII